MGYESSLHLIDIKVKPESVPVVRRTLKSGRVRGMPDLRFFLERAVLALPLESVSHD